MSTLPLSSVNSRFLAPSRFPAFHLKCPAYFAYFELEKMRSMRSAQRQVELRRLGNQLSVHGKAHLLCKIVKCCRFCLFWLSPGRVGPGIKITRVIVARAKSVWRLDGVLQYQLRPLAVKNSYSRFLWFFVRSVPLFLFAGVGTYVRDRLDVESITQMCRTATLTWFGRA